MRETDDYDETDEVRHTEIIERNGSSLSWSAVIAGLVLMVALGWLFFLLGSALGVTIADASDAAALGTGFGIAATVWLIVSALASFFFGGLLAGRLASTPDRGAGMLHGVTLWGLGTALLMLFGYWGVTGLLQTGQAAAKGAAAIAGEAGAAVGGEAVADSGAMARLEDELARRVSEASARAGAAAPPAAGAPPSAGTQLSETAIREAALALSVGDVGRAEAALTRDGSLTAEQARTLAQSGAAVPRTGSPDDVAQLENALRERAGTLAMERPAAAAPVSQAEARRAIEQLDAAALTAVAAPLLRGDREAAKRELAARTTLDEREVEAIVTGVEGTLRGEAQQLRGEVAQTAETASSYAQAALWASFVSGALALVASIAGASMGAAAARRTVHRVRHRRVAT